MSRSFALIGVIVVVFAASGVLFGDDKETKSDAKVVKQGGLPANYAKLGLSDDQKKKIYDLDAKADAEIAALQKKIDEAKKKKHDDQLTVLTAEQKAQLQAHHDQMKRMGPPPQPPDEQPF